MLKSNLRRLAGALTIVTVVMLSGCFLFQNRPPEAAFTVIYNVDEADVLAVALDASASTDPDGDPLTYKWSFGGEDVEVVPQVYSGTYTTAVIWVYFPVEGEYTITLEVSDGISTPSSDSIAVGTVVVPYPPPPGPSELSS